MPNQRIATPLAGLILAASLLSSLGCATPVYRRDQGRAIGMGASTYDVVLPGPRSRLTDAGWEQTRNNDNLSEVTGADRLRRNMFPSLNGPTLDRQRNIHIGRSDRSFIYFSRPASSGARYP